MAVESRALPLQRVAVVPSGVRPGATGATPLGPAVVAPRRRITFAGGIAILSGATLVALAVPFMVIAFPVVLLARLVLWVVWARTRPARTGSSRGDV